MASHHSSLDQTANYKVVFLTDYLTIELSIQQQSPICNTITITITNTITNRALVAHKDSLKTVNGRCN